MKKTFLLYLFLPVFFCVLPVCADSWDDFTNVDRMWDGQKSITNQQFEQVMEKLEEKGKLKEEKFQKKKRKKLFGSGTTLHSELNPDGNVQEIQAPNAAKEGILINLPVCIMLEGKPLEKGFYKVFGKKDEESKKIYLEFYQSQFFKGKLEVIETQEDYDEETVDFANVVPYGESFVKIIFGSIDFNAYAIVPYAE